MNKQEEQTRKVLQDNRPNLGSENHPSWTGYTGSVYISAVSKTKGIHAEFAAF
ncbi:MAG: hypothetical protein KME57_07525 [Scytonema hyalinum WJT4-NPBG1]|jgi:hypothetical protein|nr:hypothetical protein [Scytonema hyalinum WJT4-NPBG1]